MNWSEVVQKIAYKGKDPDQLGEWVLALGPKSCPSTGPPRTRPLRCIPTPLHSGSAPAIAPCLSLAAQRDAVVLTADQAWARMSDLGVAVTLIR